MSVVFVVRETPHRDRVVTDVYLGPDLDHLRPVGNLLLSPEEAAELRNRLVGDQAANERAMCARELARAAEQVEAAAETSTDPPRMVPYEVALVTCLRMIVAWLREGERARSLFGLPAKPKAPR